MVYAEPHEAGPLDMHALVYPFTGVVLKVVRTQQGHSRRDMVSLLIGEDITSQMTPTRTVMCLVCLDEDLRDTIAKRTSRIPRTYGDEADERVSLLWFVEDDLLDGWRDRFPVHAEMMRKGDMGTLIFASPFIPVVPGTNNYMDSLR